MSINDAYYLFRQALKNSAVRVQKLNAQLKEALTYKVELHKSKRLVQKLEKKAAADQVVAHLLLSLNTI